MSDYLNDTKEVSLGPIKRIKGEHLLCDMWGCDPGVLNDEKQLLAIAMTAAQEANATVLNATSHSFTPQGVTILLLLAESHLSIHTWPESGYAAMDIFTCGINMDPKLALKKIQMVLKPESYNEHLVQRGEENVI